MALRIELKPGERILIGESVLINGDHRASFLVEGAAPILRERDILTPEQADTPAKRIYLAVQLMYTSRDPRAHHDVYFALMRDIVQVVARAHGVEDHEVVGDAGSGNGVAAEAA